jgi:uncharacterized protein YndB with AHSA1/START domain
MSQSKQYEAVANGSALVFTRNLNAPPERVWNAWTDAGEVVQWWGPEGFATKVTKLDLRPGGNWHYVMIGPDGTEYPALGVFREIVPGKRFVSTDEFGEGMEDMFDIPLPEGMVMTVELAPKGEGTLLTLTVDHASEADRRKHEDMGVVEGWGSSLDCLEAFLNP